MVYTINLDRKPTKAPLCQRCKASFAKHYLGPYYKTARARDIALVNLALTGSRSP